MNSSQNDKKKNYSLPIKKKNDDIMDEAEEQVLQNIFNMKLKSMWDDYPTSYEDALQAFIDLEEERERLENLTNDEGIDFNLAEDETMEERAIRIANHRDRVLQEKIQVRQQKRAERIRIQVLEKENAIEKRRLFVRQQKMKKIKDNLDTLLRKMKQKEHFFFHTRFSRVDLFYGQTIRTVPTRVLYFGETVDCNNNRSDETQTKGSNIGHPYAIASFVHVPSPWIPHGQGKIIDTITNTTIFYEGGFHFGKMHGNGTYVFSNGDKWINGTFHFDQLHGIGEYQKKGFCDNEVTKDVIFHFNQRICCTDELVTGITIQLLCKKDHIHCNTYPMRFKPDSDQSRSVSAMILGMDDKRGYFKVKMHDTGVICSLNLAIELFQIDHTKVRVMPLELVFEDKPKEEIDLNRYKKQINRITRYVPNVFSSHEENIFSNKRLDEDEILEAEILKREKNEAETCEKYELEARNEEIRRTVEKEILKHRKECKTIEAHVLKDTTLFYECEMRRKTEKNIKEKRDKENKVARSRKDYETQKHKLLNL